MVPFIELRGAVLYSQFLDMPVIPSYIVCAIGNIVPVPLIYFFAHKILVWGKDKKIIGGIFSFLLNKGHNAGAKLTEQTNGECC